MTPLPLEVAEPIRDVASAVQCDPQWLASLIAFESGFDPKAENPTSSAKGLIQFVDATARELGYASSADLVKQHPLFMSQMYGPVRQYLEQYSPYHDRQELYMAVFYPAARTWEPDAPFPEWVTRANPGIETPADYVALVDQFQTDILEKAGPLSTAVVAAGDEAWKVVKVIAGIGAAMLVIHSLS